MKHERLFPQAYEAVVANPTKRYWTDGDIVHRVSKCECDKCKLIMQERLSRRVKYTADYRNANRAKLHNYQRALRAHSTSLGRPTHIQVMWCGSPWIEKDFEFYTQCREFAKSNSMSVNEFVRSALSDAIKKGVRS